MPKIFLFQLNQLEVLNLAKISNEDDYFSYFDIAPIASLTQLRTLFIDDTRIKNFNGIENLNIENLFLQGTTSFQSLQSIMTLRKLKKLMLPDIFIVSYGKKALNEYPLTQIQDLLLFLKVKEVIITTPTYNWDRMPDLLKFYLE